MRYFLIFLLLVGTSAHAQVTLIKEAPPDAPATTDLRTPNGTAAHTGLRAHLLLTVTDMDQVHVGLPFTHIGMSYFRGTNVPAGGTFRIYLQNTTDTDNLKSTTWTTAIGDMTLVYDGPWSLPTGEQPAMVDVVLDNTFTYSGNGLYLAYEYVGSTFATTTAVNHALNAGTNRVRVGTSTTTTLPDTLTNSSGFVPQIRFGYLNPNNNELGVESLSVPFGYHNKLWGNTRLSTTIANRGALDQPNIPVTVQVTGANSLTETLVIPALANGEVTTLDLDDILYPNTGENTIRVSVPADEVPDNNALEISQWISCDAVSYTGDEVPFDNIGFNTGTGILAVRYTTPPVPVTINGVYVEIGNMPANLGKTVSGQLLDNAGQILASSDPVVLTADHLGQRVFFPLNSPVDLAANVDFHAGLLQTAGTPGYFPVATSAPAIIPPNRTYSFPATGGAGTQYIDLGNFKIGANVLPRTEWQRSPAGNLNHGQDSTFTASDGFTDYHFMVNGNSAQQGPSREFTYQPVDGDVVSLEVTRHGCEAAPTDTFTLTVLTREVTGSPDAEVDDITAGLSGGGGQCSFSSAGFVPLSNVPVAPPTGVNMPYGLFDFVAENCTAEGGEDHATLNLTITYPNALPSGTQYWKFHPGTQEWFVLPGAVINGNQISFTIVDGGMGDVDDIVNGIIRDPGGPGIRNLAGAVPAPTLSLWGLLLLSGLLACLGVGQLRRNP